MTYQSLKTSDWRSMAECCWCCSVPGRACFFLSITQSYAFLKCWISPMCERCIKGSLSLSRAKQTEHWNWNPTSSVSLIALYSGFRVLHFLWVECTNKEEKPRDVWFNKVQRTIVGRVLALAGVGHSDSLSTRTWEETASQVPTTLLVLKLKQDDLE
jgi:hypothetical protein